MLNNVSAAAGTYWASYSITGLVAPGDSGSIFTPLVLNTDGTRSAGNAIQSTHGTTWNPTVDATFGTTNRIPLTVNGTTVPEPTTVALLGVAGVATLAVARGRPQAAV